MDPVFHPITTTHLSSVYAWYADVGTASAALKVQCGRSVFSLPLQARTAGAAGLAKGRGVVAIDGTRGRRWYCCYTGPGAPSHSHIKRPPRQDGAEAGGPHRRSTTMTASGFLSLCQHLHQRVLHGRRGAHHHLVHERDALGPAAGLELPLLLSPRVTGAGGGDGGGGGGAVG